MDSSHIVRSQVRMVIKSMKTLISEAIVAKLNEIPQIRYVAFDKVRLLASDFKDVEIPAIQLIDIRLDHEHQAPRSKKFWQIALELLLKGNQYHEISQQDLWNLEYEVLRKLFERPNFGIRGMIHIKYLGSSTDLHLLEPYYFSRMDFEVQFYEDLIGQC